jgi:hypothetical protein
VSKFPYNYNSTYMPALPCAWVRVCVCHAGACEGVCVEESVCVHTRPNRIEHTGANGILHTALANKGGGADGQQEFSSFINVFLLLFY